MLDQLRKKGFETKFQNHAPAILERDFPRALDELQEVLLSVEIPINEIIGSGGGETKGTQRMRKALAEKGWTKAQFKIEKTINDIPRESITHEIDHVKTFRGDFEGNGTIALEIEWNNKDPFFDRDLENFKRLHAEDAICLGIILTRGSTLHSGMRDFVARFGRNNRVNSAEDLARLGIDPTPKHKAIIERQVQRGKDFRSAWVNTFVSSKYGEATTHWRKLMDRVARGVGSPCPLALIGLPASVVTFPKG